MLELLMLGIVPGTDIQINFGDWLAGAAIIGACFLTLVIVRHRLVLVAVMLALAIRAEQRRFKIAQTWAQRRHTIA